MSLQKLALELAALEKLKLEMQKEMERIAIRSIVNLTQSKVKASGQQIQSKMHSSMDEVKQFASQTMVASITPIFAGKAADSSKNKLASIQMPSLPNLVR